jgi:cystathionine gamma-synthase
MDSKSDFLSDCHQQTRAIHVGYEPHPDIVQPIHLSTTFQRDLPEKVGGYTRSGNPNRDTLEKRLAILEQGSEAVAFSSGMAAINAILEVTLKSGDHVIFPDDCYHGTRALLKNIFIKQGIAVTEVDMTEIGNVASAIQSTTRLIWMESPSNPQLKVTDIEALANLAKKKNILTACDSTFATPLFQHPLQLGVDIVMHSTTKFLGGHSDILGGVVITRIAGELPSLLRLYQNTAGAVPSPFDCWLLNRSLATFTLRVTKQSGNAMEIASFLSTHPAIEKVYYPGLSTHLNHEVAKRQMLGGFGGVLSILVKGGREEAIAFIGRLQLVRHATSLGGVESLIEHRRSAEGKMPVSPDNLLRISAGIEHHEDLIRDLASALSGT